MAWGPLIALELDALRGNAFFDGSGTDDDVTLGPALTFGPEPTTATLLGLGLIGLGLMRKRAA